MENHRRKCGLVCVNETPLQEKTAQSVCPGDHGSETFHTREKYSINSKCHMFLIVNSRGGFPHSFSFPCDQASGPQPHKAMTTNPVFSRSVLNC